MYVCHVHCSTQNSHPNIKVFQVQQYMYALTTWTTHKAHSWHYIHLISTLDLRPWRQLKLDDKVLVSTCMRFWSRIKKATPKFLRQATFRGIPPISHPGIVCLSAHAFQYMFWYLGCMNIDSRPRFVLISCLFLSGSLGLKIDPCQCMCQLARILKI
jgi:hypothetical protein